jgi:hypothetical protein
MDFVLVAVEDAFVALGTSGFVYQSLNYAFAVSFLAMGFSDHNIFDMSDGATVMDEFGFHEQSPARDDFLVFYTDQYVHVWPQ